MKNLIFVKLGGGLITDKNQPYTPKLEIIENLAKEIAEAKKEKNFSLILGNGAGSFAHPSAKKYDTAKGFLNPNSKFGFCFVHNDAAELNKIFITSLLKLGEKVFSIAPSSCFIGKNSKISDSYLKIIKKLLDYDIIPVVYGDTAIDLEKGCCIFSTEDIFSYLAKKMKPQKIIMVSKVNGVYTDDPVKNEKAEFIPKINKNNWKKVKNYLKESDGIDVTGGMAQKVEKCLELARQRCVVSIISGSVPGNLKKALLGETLGTQIEW